MSVWLVIIDPTDSTEDRSVILLEITLLRRIFILVSGTRNEIDSIKKYFNYDS